PVALDVIVHEIKEAGIGGIAMRDALCEVGRERDYCIARIQHFPEQGHASRGDLSEVERISAIRARDERKCPVRSAFLDRSLIEAERVEPPHEIAPAIAARHAAMSTNGQVQRPASTSSSVICAPDAPEPTTSTAPGGS